MCAMMPMLRTLVRSVSTSSATSGAPLSLCQPGPSRLPAVVRERLVGLGHLVHVLATLHGRAQAVAGVEDLVHQPLGHRLLTTSPRVVDEPAQGERRLADRTDLDRDLVRRATDATRADLERRADVLERTLQDDDGVSAGLVTRTLESAVHDAPVSYTHLRAHETRHDLVCRLLLEK